MGKAQNELGKMKELLGDNRKISQSIPQSLVTEPQQKTQLKEKVFSESDRQTFAVSQIPEYRKQLAMARNEEDFDPLDIVKSAPPDEKMSPAELDEYNQARQIAREYADDPFSFLPVAKRKK